MTNARVLKEKKVPKALICGMLKDGERILFLKRLDANGIERLEMPCILNYGEDPVTQLTQEFRRQTGIDGEIGEIVFEARHNAGSRKKKVWIPCLVFKIMARNTRITLAKEFSGFRWLSVEDVKKEKLDRKLEWITVH